MGIATGALTPLWSLMWSSSSCHTHNIPPPPRANDLATGFAAQAAGTWPVGESPVPDVQGWFGGEGCAWHQLALGAVKRLEAASRDSPIGVRVLGSGQWPWWPSPCGSHPPPLPGRGGGCFWLASSSQGITVGGAVTARCQGSPGGSGPWVVSCCCTGRCRRACTAGSADLCPEKTEPGWSLTSKGETTQPFAPALRR